MVCLGSLILKKSEHFEEFYKTPKPPSRLSAKEIKEYLGKYGWVNEDDSTFDFNMPFVIASPIDKPKKGLEFKSGETGDIEYSGIIDGMQEGDFSDAEAYSYLGRGAYFKNRKINMDTYFNKVLYEGWRRGIIELDRQDGTIFLNDLFCLRFRYSMNRNKKSIRRFKS